MFQEIIDTDSAQKLPIPQDAWLLFRSGNHEIIRINLKPGESIDKHTNPWRILFYVLEGSGVLNIGEEEHTLVAHQMIAVPSGLMRNWTNTGSTDLKLLVIKTEDGE